MDIPHMVAHMVASAVRDMPGVVASGSTTSGIPQVYIAMRTDKGYVMTVVQVVEFPAPLFEASGIDHSKPGTASDTMLAIARRRHGDICPECNVPWQTPSPNCPHLEFDLHPRPYRVSTDDPYGLRGIAR